MTWARANLGSLLTILGFLGAAGAAYVAYAADRRVDPVETRVTVLETQQARDSEWRRGVDRKLDRILERLPRQP